MKQVLSLVITFSFLISCNQKKIKKTNLDSNLEEKENIKKDQQLKQKSIDTAFVFYPVDYDTIFNIQNIEIEKSKHLLKIITFSLNDSSIVNINENYKETYHNYVSQIILMKQNDTIFNTEISKTFFKDSLNDEFFRRCILNNIKYNGVKLNKIYFKGSFFVPDTDWAFGNEFSIFYTKEKQNQVNSWNYKDIGL